MVKQRTLFSPYFLRRNEMQILNISFDESLIAMLLPIDVFRKIVRMAMDFVGRGKPVWWVCTLIFERAPYFQGLKCLLVWRFAERFISRDRLFIDRLRFCCCCRSRSCCVVCSSYEIGFCVVAYIKNRVRKSVSDMITQCRNSWCYRVEMQ